LIRAGWGSFEPEAFELALARVKPGQTSVVVECLAASCLIWNLPIGPGVFNI